MAVMNRFDSASESASPAPILPGEFFNMGSQVLRDAFRSARPAPEDYGKLLADGFSCLRWLNRYQHLWPPFAPNHTVQIDDTLSALALLVSESWTFVMCTSLHPHILQEVIVAGLTLRVHVAYVGVNIDGTRVCVCLIATLWFLLLQLFIKRCVVWEDHRRFYVSFDIRFVCQ
jgi:hypothetical protein